MFEDLQFYAPAYLTIGAVMLMAVWFQAQSVKRAKSDWLDKLYQELRPEQRTLRYRILNNVIGPFLGGVLIVGAWPVLLIVLGLILADEVRGKLLDRRHQRHIDMPPVLRKELITRFEIYEIERSELIDDPRGAVPGLPFGHLYPRWLQLKSHLKPEDQVWSFRARRETAWNQTTDSLGYAVLRGAEVVAHFANQRIAVEVRETRKVEKTYH